MPADARVTRGHDRLPPRAPLLDDAVDRRRREIGPVGEDDDRRFDLRAESREAAAERRSRPELPLGTADGPLAGLELVRAEDDDDLVDSAPPNALQHGLEQKLLLRRAEAGGGSRREDDGGDRGRYRQRRSARQRAVTFATYVSVWGDGAPPARSTADGPALYAASARSTESKRRSSCRR